MGTSAFLCVAIGVFPGWLYEILPYNVDYVPYTTTHVVTQIQLLVFSALAFGWLTRSGLFPPHVKSTNLDFDWTYRRLLPNIVGKIGRTVTVLDKKIRAAFINRLEGLIAGVFRHHGPEGLLARTNSVGASVAVIVALLAVFVITFFLEF
jgi:multicomponent Na+:H+ antiporter subunit D